MSKKLLHLIQIKEMKYLYILDKCNLFNKHVNATYRIKIN